MSLMAPEIVICFITMCNFTMMDPEPLRAAFYDIGQSLRS